ncbi:MAG: hypothetical protein AB1414_00010, partial [bacterium]
METESSKPNQHNNLFITRFKKLDNTQSVSKIISFIDQKLIKGLLSLFVIGTVVFCFEGLAKAAVIGGANVDPDKVWWYDHRNTSYTDMTNAATSTGNVTLGSETTDVHYIGMNNMFDKIVYNIGTAGDSGTVTWEYWNSSSGTWTTLTIATDTTHNFTTLGIGTVSFTIPDNWGTYTVYGEANKYWIRAVTMGTYTVVPKASQISVVEYNFQITIAKMDGSATTGLTSSNFTFGGGTDNEIKGFREIGSTGVYQFALKPDNYNGTVTVTGYLPGTFTTGALNTTLTDKGTLTLQGNLIITVSKMDGVGTTGLPGDKFVFRKAGVDYVPTEFKELGS